MPPTRFRFSVLVLVAAGACGGPETADPPPAPVTVFAAASLARPLAAFSDSARAWDGIVALTELGGSMEHARKITDLGRVPDVLLLADDEVMAALLPTHLDWYVRFATSRLVVAFTDRSRHAAILTAENWYEVLSRDGVRVGRADPATAPAGKHALTLLERAEAYYRKPGLQDRLMARATVGFLRPNATELAALLETSEVDYIIEYESVARQYGFRFVAIPADLAPPVLYGASVPRSAANAATGVRFVERLLSAPGRRILEGANVTLLRVPVAVGTNVPPAIGTHVRSLATAR